MREEVAKAIIGIALATAILLLAARSMERHVMPGIAGKSEPIEHVQVHGG
jgi:hypothetical protein